MDMNGIREAVEYFKPGSMHKIKDLRDMSDILQRVIVLRDLAERVLAGEMVLSVEEIVLIMSEYHSGNREESEKIATSIHSAQMEKLGQIIIKLPKPSYRLCMEGRNDQRKRTA